jgi:hypothetical protein
MGGGSRGDKHPCQPSNRDNDNVKCPMHNSTPQPHRPCNLQEAADTGGEAPAVKPVLRSGPGVGYAALLHFPPGHIWDSRELPHKKCPLRHRGGQHPVQRHPGQTSSVLVYGGGSLRVPGFKDVIPQQRPQDPGRP